MAITTILAGVTLATNDIVQCVHYNWMTSQYGLFGYYLQKTAGDPAFSCGDAAWALQTMNSVSIASAMCNNATLLGARVQRVHPTPPGQAGVANDMSVGTGGAIPLPTQTTGLLSMFANGSGPAQRGRMYWPFPPTGAIDVVTGLPIPAYVAVLGAFGANLVVPLNLTSEDTLRSAVMRVGVYHKLTGTIDPVVAAAGRNYWGTQRRRGDLGKQNPFAIPF